MSLLRRLMNRNMSLYDQLDTLAACGIVPREGIVPAELLRLNAERDYETSPFKLLLTALGTEGDEPPRLPMSDNVWHMHAECVARGGDYVKVAQRMATLAGDALPIESVRDQFDLHRGVAWLTFTLGSIPTSSVASPRSWKHKTPTSATSASTSAARTVS